MQHPDDQPLMKGLEFYERYEDMSPDGRLQLFKECDGDIIVTIIPPTESGILPRNQKEALSVQFCTIGSGGGQSPRVWEALNALALAIEEDNKERAQNRT